MFFFCCEIPVHALPGETRTEKRWVNLLDGKLPKNLKLTPIIDTAVSIQINWPVIGWVFKFNEKKEIVLQEIKDKNGNVQVILYQ